MTKHKATKKERRCTQCGEVMIERKIPAQGRMDYRPMRFAKYYYTPFNSDGQEQFLIEIKCPNYKPERWYRFPNNHDYFTSRIDGFSYDSK